MNMIKFASFISYLSCRFAQSVDISACENIFEHVRQINEPDRINLTPLFDALACSRKIEAIKEYRTLTGEGLLESKNAIERIYRNPVPQAQS